MTCNNTPRIYVRDIAGGWVYATGASILVEKGDEPNKASVWCGRSDVPVFVGSTQDCEMVAEQLAGRMAIQCVDLRLTLDPSRLLTVERDANGVLCVSAKYPVSEQVK